MKLPERGLLIKELSVIINEKSNKELAMIYQVPLHIITGFLARNKIKRNKEALSHKKCSICHVDKDISEFRLINNKHRANCISCESSSAQKYYIKNRVRILERGKTKHAKELNKIRKRKRFFHFKASKFITTYKFKADRKELALFLWHQWHRQSGLCAITGRKLNPNKCEIDHIIPRTKELVINDFYNLRWVTREGNRLKSNMTDEVFKQLIIDVYNNLIK